MTSNALRVLMATVLPTDLQSPRGGIEAAALQLVRALSAQQEVELHVAAFNYSVTSPIRRTIGHVSMWWLPRWRQLSTVQMLTASAVQLRLVERRVQPDLLHAQGPTPFCVAARWSRKPLVLTIHGLEMLSPRVRLNRLRRRTAELVLDLSLERAKGVISISSYVDRFLSKRLDGKLRVSIDNCVSSDLFEVPPLPGEHQLLCVGSLSELKNQLLLVRAFEAGEAAWAGWQLVLAGPTAESRYARRLESEVQRLGLEGSVRLAGSVGRSELRDLFRKSEALLLSSIQETAPVVIAEAMAAGRPVIATDVGGVREMVADGVTGFVVPVHDEMGMARAMRRLIADADLRKEMGRCARGLARERFMPRRVAAKTVDFYRLVAGRACVS